MQSDELDSADKILDAIRRYSVTLGTPSFSESMAQVHKLRQAAISLGDDHIDRSTLVFAVDTARVYKRNRLALQLNDLVKRKSIASNDTNSTFASLLLEAIICRQIGAYGVTAHTAHQFGEFERNVIGGWSTSRRGFVARLHLADYCAAFGLPSLALTTIDTLRVHGWDHQKQPDLLACVLRAELDSLNMLQLWQTHTEPEIQRRSEKTLEFAIRYFDQKSKGASPLLVNDIDLLRQLALAVVQPMWQHFRVATMKIIAHCTQRNERVAPTPDLQLLTQELEPLQHAVQIERYFSSPAAQQDRFTPDTQRYEFTLLEQLYATAAEHVHADRVRRARKRLLAQVMSPATSAGLVSATESLKQKRKASWLLAAHDLRAPLGALITLGREMQRRGDPDSLARGKRIATQAQRAMVLTQELLEEDRLEALNPAGLRPLGLAEIIDEVCEDLRPHGLQKSVQIVASLDFLVHMPADRTLIYRAVYNLLRNAVAAVPPITGIVSVALALRDKNIELRIADNGPGLPADVARALENEHSAVPSQGGYGLGLRFAVRCLRQHGFVVTYGRNDLQQTEFVFTCAASAFAPNLSHSIQNQGTPQASSSPKDPSY